jgi:NADPH-dependent 7-cyano-7-deazaguanine reductase QueF-like protein
MASTVLSTATGIGSSRRKTADGNGLIDELGLAQLTLLKAQALPTLALGELVCSSTSSFFIQNRSFQCTIA